MTCIRTGANVYLLQYGATVHGDLFAVGDVYVLALGDSIKMCIDYSPTTANLKARAFTVCGSRAIAMQKFECSDFSYDGMMLE